jgi:hypothetical protein
MEYFEYHKKSQLGSRFDWMVPDPVSVGNAKKALNLERNKSTTTIQQPRQKLGTILKPQGALCT